MALQFVVAERQVCFDEDVFALSVFEEGRLLQIGVNFGLIDGGNDPGLGKQVMEAVDGDIGDTNGAYFSGVKKLLHGLVCISWVDIDEIEDAVRAERESFASLAIEGALFC